MELEFQNYLLEACNGVIYDSEVLELLLNLLLHDPPFRIATFRVICSIICHLSYNKRLECSMRSEHIQLLTKAYQESISQLSKILQTPNIAELLPELLEEEWSKFKFADFQNDIDALLDDPIVIIPGLDERLVRKVPQALVYPVKEIDIMSMRIRVFLSIRYMIFHLIQNDGQMNQRMKENPIPREEREVGS